MPSPKPDPLIAFTVRMDSEPHTDKVFWSESPQSAIAEAAGLWAVKKERLKIVRKGAHKCKS